MRHFRQFTLFFSVWLMLFAVTACASSDDDDPDAQIPKITAITSDVSTIVNIPKEVSVTVEVGDKGTLSYQWYVSSSKIEPGAAVKDATKASYTPVTNATGTSYYYCVITNQLGSSTRSVTSPRITYTVSASVNALAPIIVSQPVNVTAYFGENFSLSVIAYTSDGGTLSYQWYRSETSESQPAAIDGATEIQYEALAARTTLGYYFCVITNTISDNGDGGKKTAETRTNGVTVSNSVVHANAPTITAQPVNTEAIIPATRIFTVGAYAPDGGLLSYQWYSLTDGENEGKEIAGASEARYTVNVSEVGKIGYYCVITNTIFDNGDGGNKSASIQTETAWLEAVYLKDVVPAPYFTEEPASMNIAPYGQTVKLSCKAETSGYSVSYKWYKSADGTTATGIAIANATVATLELPAFTEKGIYYYYCVATTLLSSTEGDDVNTVATLSKVVSVAYTGLPVVQIDLNTSIGLITKETYVQGSMKIISETYGNFSYEFVKEKEGLKGRGNSSWGMPKKGYNIKFDSKQSLFGLPESKKWCIIANYSDKSLLRNKFASILGTKVYNAVWNPSFISVDVIINGEYLGNYIFCEKISLDDGRIEAQDISNCTEKKIANGKYTDQNNDGAIDLYDGGFILEIDARADADFYFTTSYDGSPFTLKDPDEVTEEMQEHVRTIVQTAEDALYGDDFTNLEYGWRKFIDEDSMIDWFIVNEFAKNNDAIFFTSVYLYYNPADRTLHMGPNWDYDISCGNIDYNGCDNPEGWYIKDAKWLSRMVKDPVFIANVKSRWNEKKSELLSTISTNTGTVQTLANSISVSAEYNFMKWQILGTYVWPNPAGFEIRTTYQSEVDYMLDWCNTRYTWLDTAINGL